MNPSTTAVGVRSMTDPLVRVAVRPPSPRGDYAVAHWAQPLDLSLLLEQHAAFVALLSSLGCGVEVLPPVDDMPDACFTYDPVFVTGTGFIEFRGAKAVRVGEPPLLAAQLEALGVPRLGRLGAGATADGGDMFWLDESTLAIGRSYRTNQQAVDEIAALLAAEGARVLAYDLPHDLGPEYCLHLMSVISMVRDDLAVVHLPLAPVALVQELHRRGIAIIELPTEDYATLGGNILAIEPNVVVIAEGNDATATALRDAGVRVHEYAASEINRGEGGPTCLTRPIARVRA